MSFVEELAGDRKARRVGVHNPDFFVNKTDQGKYLACTNLYDVVFQGIGDTKESAIEKCALKVLKYFVYY
jgi:hypothetical protein